VHLGCRRRCIFRLSLCGLVIPSLVFPGFVSFRSCVPVSVTYFVPVLWEQKMVQRLQKIVADYEERMREMQLVPRLSYGLSRLTRVEKAVKKHNYNCNIQGVNVYTNVSANYMFRPLLVRPSSG